jgi:general secretion pathway protein D
MNDFNDKNFMCRALNTTILASTFLLISACSENQMGSNTENNSTHSKSIKQIVAEHKDKNTKKGEIAQGVDFMLAGNYDEAGTKFNHILTLDPTNGTVHLLNAINYQLKAKGGDIGQLDIAEAGLVQALKFNPTDALASLQLGRVKKSKKEYQKAQEEFANTLLLDPDNKQAIYELATTSYLMGDLKTARVAIERYLKAHPDKPEGLQSAAIIRAACGDSVAAKNALVKLKSIKDQDFRAKEAQRRVLDWKKLYDEGLITLAQAAPSPPPDVISTAPELVAPAADAAAAPPAAAPAAPAAGTSAKPTMVVIDALVMRSSEAGTTSKGHNILENFAVTLAPGTHLKARAKGSGNGPTNFENVNVFPTNAVAGVNIASTIAGGSQNPFSISRLFVQGVTFGSVQYSLNIANTDKLTIQVMDRPSVTTILGQKGEFFSGIEYVLGLAGQYGGSITRTPVGIELVVTPTAYDLETDTVTLDIRMYGSLQNQENPPTDVTKSFAQFSVSRVYTTVNMKMGETIMLGGIQTRTDQQDKTGFPGLQDIPGVQYLFSNESTSSERKVVSFLITPRMAADAKKLTQIYLAKDNAKDRPILSELELRNKDWFVAPMPNWVMHYRMMDGLYRDFRTGDVPSIDWDQTDSLEEQLESLRTFFYY